MRMNFLDRFLVNLDHYGGSGNRPRNKTLLWLLSLALVAVIGWLDYVTGVEIVVFSFYLIPIRLSAVGLGFLAGTVVSFCAVLAWGVSDFFAGQQYSHRLVMLWNVFMRLLAFLIVAGLSARNAMLFAEERETSTKLRKALSEIKLLQGLLPICASCKKIRDEKGEWSAVERYLQKHTEVKLTHSMCPGCMRQWAKEAGIENEL